MICSIRMQSCDLARVVRISYLLTSPSRGVFELARKPVFSNRIVRDFALRCDSRDANLVPPVGWNAIWRL